MHFISIVGTQPVATIAPICALIDAGHKISRISLLSTWKEEDEEKRIKPLTLYLIEKLRFNSNDIEVHRVSISKELRDKDPRYFTEVLIQTAMEPGWIYNIAGGMNWMAAEAAQHLDLNKGYAIYPARHTIDIFNLKDGKLIQQNLTLPKIELYDIIALHGFNPSIGEQILRPKLKSLFTHFGLVPPKECAYNVNINGVICDIVWCGSNELCMLKYFDRDKSVCNDGILQESRAFANISSNRTIMSELYHKQSYAIVESATDKERIYSHARGKINVIIAKDYSKKDFKKTKNNIQDMFLQKEPPQAIVAETRIDTNHSIHSSKDLMLAVGNDISPTLKAIWTHGPHNNIKLFYTPNEESIELHIKSISNNANLLPCNSITFIPTSISGKEIFLINQSLPPAEVNVSPGSKGQSFFLSLWAKCHGSNVYSLNTKSESSNSLIDNKHIPEKFPGLVDFLKLSGETVKDAKKYSGNEPDENFILSFMQQAHASFKSLKSFPFKKITFPNKSSCIPNGRISAQITFDGNRPVTIKNINQGFWFESIAAISLCKAGMQDVHTGVQVKWKKSTQDYLETNNPGQKIFKIDRDVVGWKHGFYWVVSCKTCNFYNDNDLDAALIEAASMAANFGRFSKAMLCNLRYDGSPQKRASGVYYLGPKTFLYPVELENLLEKIATESRTTKHLSHDNVPQ